MRRGGRRGRCAVRGDWSGRRGSNPRPTAWKAVTLPLSYSRLRAPQYSGHARLMRHRNLDFAFVPRPIVPVVVCVPSPEPLGRSIESTRSTAGLVTQRSRAPSSRERRMVAREGLEPSKPLGRQIYSLLRLTASLPRQRCVFWIRCFRRLRCRPHEPKPLELAKGFEPPTC